MCLAVIERDKEREEGVHSRAFEFYVEREGRGRGVGGGGEETGRERASGFSLLSSALS